MGKTTVLDLNTPSPVLSSPTQAYITVVIKKKIGLPIFNKNTRFSHNAKEKEPYC